MLKEKGAGFKSFQNQPDQMHRSKCDCHHQDGTDNPAFRDQNKLGKIDFSTDRQTDTDHAPYNRLGSRGGNAIKCGQGDKQPGAYQRHANSQIAEVGFDDSFANGVHDVMALEHGTQNRKNSNYNHGPSKTQQAATHCSANAICRIIGTDIPTDVGAGSQQY